MSALLTVVWVALVLGAVGWRLLVLVGLERERAPLAWLGWCLGAGALANGLLLFALVAAFGPGAGGFVTLAGAQTLLVLALGWLARRRARTAGPAALAVAPAPSADHAASAPPARAGWPELVFHAALGLCLLVALVRILVASLTPELAGDGALLWGFKARAIEAHGLGAGFVEALANPSLRHEDYPLLNPLLQAWVLVLEGGRDFVLVRLPMQLAALGLLVALADGLRRRGGPLLGALLLVGLSASPLTRGTLTSAGAEVFVALGLVMAVEGWQAFERERRTAWLGLASLGAALALFAKHDARLFVLCLVVAIGLRWALLLRVERGPVTVGPAPGPLRQVWAAARGWPLLPLGVLAATLLFNARAGFVNDLTSGKGSGKGFLTRLGEQFADHIGTTADFFARHMLGDPRYDSLVLVAGLATAFLLAAGSLAGAAGIQARLGRSFVAGATALGSVAGLFLIYLSTPQPLQWHLDSSALRVAWQLLPLAALGLASALGLDPEPRPRAGTAQPPSDHAGGP